LSGNSQEKKKFFQMKK